MVRRLPNLLIGLIVVINGVGSIVIASWGAVNVGSGPPMVTDETGVGDSMGVGGVGVPVSVAGGGTSTGGVSDAEGWTGVGVNTGQ